MRAETEMVLAAFLWGVTATLAVLALLWEWWTAALYLAGGQLVPAMFAGQAWDRMRVRW